MLIHANEQSVHDNYKLLIIIKNTLMIQYTMNTSTVYSYNAIILIILNYSK